MDLVDLQSNTTTKEKSNEVEIPDLYSKYVGYLSKLQNDFLKIIFFNITIFSERYFIAFNFNLFLFCCF